jgi:hypothetical protein
MTIAELANLLKSALLLTAAEQRQALDVVEQRLTCTYPVTPTSHCGWQANAGRHAPSNARIVLQYLPAWVARAHCHHMRHVFWNRFPYSPRFFPQIPSDSEKEELYRDYYDPKWRRKFDSMVGDLEVEIDYPEDSPTLPIDD